MQCSSCQTDLSAGDRFCAACGAPVQFLCASCGHPYSADSLFCAQCGTRLTTPDGSPPPVHGERRNLTVMFCDLVGSTPLSSRLDPEDLGELIRGYQSGAAAILGRFGGFIARYVGDGLLVYFGWPQAREADAERAVRAALAIAAAIGQHLIHGERLQVRIGIATGLVVVGEPIGAGESQQQTAIGETPNRAARLQALAEPNGVVIDAATHQQLGRLFVCRSLGAVALKGLPAPVQTWAVQGESAMMSRFEALHPAALTPLISRDEEVDLLLRRWRQAGRGEGKVVLITGEAGIGKSRLLAALQERLEGEPCARLRYFCSPYHQDSPLHPVIGQLEHAAEFVRDDTARDKLNKLRTMLADTATSDEGVAVLAGLLSIPMDVSLPSLTLSPQRHKERTFEVLIGELAALARQQPVLMMVEDLHWADPSSCELFDRIIERLAELPMLLVMTFRPEYEAPWIGRAGVSLVTLARLDRRETAAMAAEVAEHAIPSELIDLIVAQTDGVPLFVEELTRTVLEAGLSPTAAGQRLAVPETLQASLLERIDRLPEAKLAAQIGAVIGRSFTYELIRVVAEMPEAALRTNLKQLVSAGLVFERGVPPEASFTFKHALVQDVAYESLLRGRRAALHARVADALCTRRPWSTECQPELLNSRIADAVSPRPEVEPEVIAYHLTEAGRTREAVSHWLLAGQRAAGRSAEREAVSLLRRGLTALDTLPESDERDRQELAFQMALGMPLVATERYGTDVVGSVFERARILSRRLGDAQSQLIATYGAFVNNIARGDHRAAAQISEQATDQFASEDNPTCRLILHRMAGFTAFQAGMFREARRKMEAVLALYDLEVHRPLAGRWIDARVATLDHLTLVLWLLGYPDQAYRRMEEAFEAASRVSHAGSIGHVHFFAGVLFADMRRDPIALQQRSAAAVAFAREHGQIGSGREFFRGLALLECGVQAEGLALAEQSLERMERFGLEERPYLLCRLSATYAHLGHIEKAWDTIVQAQLVAERTADHIWDAEVDRVAGTVLLAKGASALEVEARFRKAIDLARQQDAKSLELRAAIDLARLWIGQGKGADARMMLVPIHAWFTEGFDTPDLKEAAALLAELGGTQV